MKSKEFVAILQERLPMEQFKWEYNEKEDRLRLDHKGIDKGMDISISDMIVKYKQKKEQAIDEIVHTIRATFDAMEKEATGGFHKDALIYPVIRSASFPKKTKSGSPFITQEHTAETTIFYALDLGETYRLIDERMLDDLKKSKEEIQETALFNVRRLSTSVKKDTVADNDFYFVNNNDGYDASRILNEAFLKEMAAKMKGDMTVSVPHQDVLIIGDIRNKTGYDVLAQMAMQFFTNGAVPVTSLSFVYEKGQLEPIFILAKNRIANKKGNQ